MRQKKIKNFAKFHKRVFIFDQMGFEFDYLHRKYNEAALIGNETETVMENRAKPAEYDKMSFEFDYFAMKTYMHPTV